MIRVLLTGKLHDIPQERESANGNTYAVAKVKADDKGGNWIWASVIAFGVEAERLLLLDAGDAVAISGRAELSVWTDKEGNSRPNLSVLADEVATLKGRPRPRQPRAPRKIKPQEPPVAGIPFDDALPDFGDAPTHRRTDAREDAPTPNTSARNTPKKKRKKP